MAIFRRKNGTFEAEVYVNGKRIESKKGFKNKKTAKEWHDGKLLLYKRGELSSDRKEFTMDELFTKYEEIHLPQLALNSQIRYRGELERKLKPYFKYRKIKDIGLPMILDFRAKLLKQDLSPKSVNDIVGLLRSIFRLGIDYGMLSVNPVTVKTIKVPRLSYQWWQNWSDVQLFLEGTKRARYGLAFRLALECGLRQAEIVGLCKKDIDLERCQIHVHRQWLWKHESYSTTKQNRERYVGFEQNSELHRMLRRAVEDKAHPEILFVTENGKIVRPNFLYDSFKEWIRKLELPPIRFHDLRHTFASWYMIRVGDMWQLMEILGHSDIKMTMKYSHLSKDVKRVPSLDAEKFTAFSRREGHLSVVK